MTDAVTRVCLQGWHCANWIFAEVSRIPVLSRDYIEIHHFDVVDTFLSQVDVDPTWIDSPGKLIELHGTDIQFYVTYRVTLKSPSQASIEVFVEAIESLKRQ